MKRRITLMLLCAMIGVVGAAARDCQVQEVEGGIYAGVTGPLGGYRGSSGAAYVSLGWSISYNIPSIPVDCGAFMQLDNVERRFEDGRENNQTLSAGLLGHYNFRQCGKMNPFVGLGIGVGYNHTIRSVCDSQGTSMVFMPQVGVEFWHLIRLTGYAMLCRKGYNCVGLTLGFSFGGRPRR